MPNGSADGTRWIDVGPERLVTWLESFSQRHGGGLVTEPGPAVVRFRAADAAAAECHVPFPPLPDGIAELTAAADTAERISMHASAGRTVGVLLVRLGGYAAGVFTGPSAHLAASKVGSRLVHGRSAAGGTSQLAGLRDDPRLRQYFRLAAERFLTVPDPRLAVLRGTPRLFRAIRIRLTDPPPPTEPESGG